MPKKPEKLLIVLLALAWVFDFLFWESAIGINLVILLEITLISAGYLLFKEGFQLARRSVWLLLPIAFFSMVTVIRREPLTLFLAYLFSFLLMAILINDWIKGHWIFYNLADYFKKVMRLIGSTLTKSAKFTREILKLRK